jgi:putative FmdB family regulatory protein
MPTYEYVCKRCGKRFDVFQSFSEKPLRVHEDCGGELQKVFHPAGIIFKGSGFYVTDSAKKGEE